MNTKITEIKDGIFRVRVSDTEEYRETLLERYGFLFDEKIKEEPSGKYSANFDSVSDTISFSGGKKALNVTVLNSDGSKYSGNGFLLKLPVDDKERFFGLGDESRDAVMKRGRKAVMWQKNVISYGPIPFMVSSEGWGILVNCTYRHEFDIAAASHSEVRIEAKKGNVDFYIFFADSMKQIIGLYTELTGRPLVMPKQAYGLIFVNNEEETARDMLHNGSNFRREDIPCDIMGLEPGWMSKHYDYTINKKWDPERFCLPYWQPENFNGPGTFFYNLRQMGFGLTLWLCCDYDLLWHEEGDSLKCAEYSFEGASIIDDHFRGDVLMDKFTKPGEAWFEHLKKFVDQGATGFKLDGALQVMEHPDRLWAGRYTDDEVHNIYPLIYAKQMQKGYEEYTKRRSLIYTPSMYAGTQHYAATWAGDTGGGEDILGYVLNMSFCGHTNATCDMDITTPEGVHFGFLMPWTQLLAWKCWHHPWLLGDELEGIIRDYSKLRSSLFPYIYSMAHKAAETGLPLVRPLSLAYENNAEYDDVKNMYMFGDSLLVGAFNMNLTLPEGRWIDWFTGETYDGGCNMLYTPPKGKGGALLAKEGSVIVTQTPKRYITEKKETEYQIRVFPGGNAEFMLIDDDGETYEYLDGKVNSVKLELNMTNYGFNVKMTNMSDKYKRSEECRFEILAYSNKSPESVMCNGAAVDYRYDEDARLISVNIDKQYGENGEYQFYIR